MLVQQSLSPASLASPVLGSGPLGLTAGSSLTGAAVAPTQGDLFSSSFGAGSTAGSGSTLTSLLSSMLSMLCTVVEQITGQSSGQAAAAPVAADGTAAGAAATGGAGGAGAYGAGAGAADATGAGAAVQPVIKDGATAMEQAEREALAPPVAAAAPATGAAPVAAGGVAARRPVIAQIDNFTTDNSGFNHGQEIASTLQAGTGGAELLQFSLNGQSATANAPQIATALQQVIQRVQSGQPVDAVVIPQQNNTNDANTAQVQQAIETLTALGVPVVVAAGNNGPAQQNALASNSAFVVQNTQGGAVDPDSGQGNINFEGRTTSFASANLAAAVAQLRAQGLSPAQIRAQLGGA